MFHGFTPRRGIGMCIFYSTYTCDTAMRTLIEIDDRLMKRAMRAAGTSTRREAVKRALEVLIRLENQRSIRDIRGKYNWEGDLDAMRRLK